MSDEAANKLTGGNVLPGWPATMTWLILKSTELRDRRLRHVPQFQRSAARSIARERNS